MDAFEGLADGMAHATSMDAATVAKPACETFLSMDITSSGEWRVASGEWRVASGAWRIAVVAAGHGR
ncbi:hypothetical protein GCM10011400_57880 [Paraburkholderia caffeinilytica]|uniref:DUF4440 domain-containing protein n=1 Tax=Paraburkholderia caffeinilytica TaxID=1761016 RepID=A0ABQ1N9L3_9BURK|nr:hypothetical protein GCM10011400_57880 [Paraburkholderia caffeinilytica]